MSMTTTSAPTPTARAGAPMPRATAARPAATGTGAAPLRNNGYRILQVVLFVSGAVLLPLGLIVIILGWYGAAHTPYQYDQLSYLVSGGLLGLGLTFCGGFLYFGAWLARIASDNRDTSSPTRADAPARISCRGTPSRSGNAVRRLSCRSTTSFSAPSRAATSSRPFTRTASGIT